ncbi:hypothetical protein LTR84_003899 [Exophiala bonariae]|uniref:Extracellular membrane protein CFEM domain-containing protein n=1 Tax=Exophiala bonariae TaxID=1690606 RepID=A0AAV9N6T3_9EURO|nr:hypothetical protein LTR84_003899 [Exophiala bonariae]
MALLEHFKPLALIMAVLHLALAVNIESITLVEAPGYTNLRGCAKYCFQSNDNGNVQSALSCDMNSCLCRSDLATDAHSIISSCIYTQQCKTTNEVDLSLGLSFFDGYCSSYQYAFTAPATATVIQTESSGPSNNPPNTAQPGSSPSTKSTVTVTITSTPTSRASYTTFTTTSTLQSTKLSSPSSTTTGSSSISSTNDQGSSNSNGSSKDPGRQDTLTIVFGLLGVAVAIIVAIWQGRNKNTWTRQKVREVREWNHERRHHHFSARNSTTLTNFEAPSARS